MLWRMNSLALYPTEVDPCSPQVLPLNLQKFPNLELETLPPPLNCGWGWGWEPYPKHQ